MPENLNTLDETHYTTPWGSQWWRHEPSCREAEEIKQEGNGAMTFETWLLSHLSCVQFMSQALTPAPLIIQNLFSNVFKRMCFWWAQQSSLLYIPPQKGLIQPGKVRKLNPAHGKTLHAAFCCRLFFPQTHTHTHRVMYVKNERLIPGKPIWYLFQSLP